MKPISAIARTGDAVTPEAPWLGLRPFTKDLRPYFFGRDRELENLFERVAQRGLTVLFGQSGLGKTSLIQAALIPRLQNAGFYPVLLRLDHAENAESLEAQVLAALAPVMAEATERSVASIQAETNSGLAPLWQLLHDPDAGLCRPGAPRIVLLLDQFEEIFTLGQATLKRREESRAFFHTLADIVENRVPSALRPVLEADDDLADRLDYSARPLKFLLALREDFLHCLERWRPQLPSLMDNRLELRLLTGPQALLAVIEPGRLRCRENPALPPIVDDSTGAEIVRFVAGAPPEMPLAEIDAVPPLLSLICAELNAQRFAVPEGTPPEPVIRPEQLGGRAEDVLENFYVGAFAAEPPVVRTLVEDRLLSAEGFRESLALDSALAELNRNGIPPAEASATLKRLVDKRLLVEEERGGVRRVELTHDVLTKVARRSRDERRSREEAERLKREKAEAEVRAAKERQRLQRARLVGGAMTLLAVFAVAAGVWAWKERGISAEREKAAVGAKIQAERETARADEQLRTVSRSDRATATGFLFSGEWRKGIAYLGRALANWPDNDTAAAQLWSATLNGFPGRDVLPRMNMAHFAPVTSVAFSPDGKRLLTGSNDRTARLWDAQSGKELLTLQGHSGVVTSVAFSPDGKRLLTGSNDNTARLWDAQSGKELVTLQGHSGRITSVAFSPDGRHLLTGSDDRTARLWDAQSGKELVTLQGHSGVVTSVAFSPDGKRLLTGSWDNTVRLWDAQSGKELLILQEHSGFVMSVAFSPDGKRLLTGSWDNTARLWDAQSGKELVTLQGHSGTVTSVAFSPDGKRLLTGSNDNTARLWDAQSGKKLVTLQGHSDSITSVVFSPDGKRLLTGSNDNTARLWDAQSGKELVTLQGHSDSITSVAFSPDGKRLLTGSDDNTARLWDTQSGKELVTLQGHSDSITSVAFSPDGKHLLTGSSDNTARFWDAQSGKELVTLQGHSGNVTSVAFSPDSKRLLTGSSDNTARLWDAQSGKELVTLQGHSGNVTSVAFSPDGKRLLTGSDDNTARLWDAQSGKDPIILQGHSDSVTSVAFSPDGKRLLTGSWDNTARLWDAQSGKELVTLQGHSGVVTSVAFSPDGRHLLTGSDDNTARLWDAQSGKELLILQEHSGFVMSVAFSPGGERIATAQDSEARIWTLPPSLGPAPAWQQAWVRVACGYEFNEDGVLREIPAAQRLEERERLPRAAEVLGHWAPLLEYIEPKRSETR